MRMKNTKSRDRKPDVASPQKSGGAKLKLTVQYAVQGVQGVQGEEDIPTRPMFRKWVKAALMQDAEIVLRVVDEPEGRNLNRSFRGKDYATNVLTFDYRQDEDGNGSHEPLSGDIVLCAPVVEKEAREQCKNLEAHYAHLTIHGVLHLQGHEHEEDAAAESMERLEVEILSGLGYANPYCETHSEK